MYQGAVRTAKQGAITVFPYVAYRYKRNDELKILDAKTENAYNKLHGTEQLHPLEQISVREVVEQKIQRAHCPLLNGEAACLNQMKAGAKFVQASIEKFMD